MNKINYTDYITNNFANNPIWQNLSYDNEGLLWLDNICLVDLINRYGTPLQINYMPIVSEKGDYLKKIVSEIATEIGYTGGFNFLYATKANMRAWYLTEACSAGWDIETSSNQDLINIQYLIDNNFVKNDIKIVCNGLKKLYHLNRYQKTLNDNIRSGIEVEFDDNAFLTKECSTDSYSENIVKLHNNGINIIPILDQDEFEYFANQDLKRRLKVGLRMKFGKVTNKSDLEKFTSRHGLSWDQLKKVAQDIDKIKQLELVILHAMPGVSADAMSEEKLSDALLFAVDHYFLLKCKHPTLTTLNIGGGLPPTLRGFNYKKFLSSFLKRVKTKAQEFGQPEPIIMFELGTYLVDESGFYIYKVLQNKLNHINTKNNNLSWAIIDSSIMTDLPDSWITNKNFIILAANCGKSSYTNVVLGDVTCDSDGCYPVQDSETKHIAIPDTSEELYLVVVGTGAYQRLLTGDGGAHHCGVPDPKTVVITKSEGKKIVSLKSSQTTSDIMNILGYK